MITYPYDYSTHKIKTHSNPISLENGNTLQLFVIQREKENLMQILR